MIVFFSNDIDVKVTIDPLLNDFRNDSIIFFLFPSLSSYGKISIRSFYYIPDFFLFKYGLYKVGPLRAILELIEFFSLFLTIVILINHFNDLEKGKNVILMPVHTPDLIT